MFDDPEEMQWVKGDHHREVNKGHGRLETRECWSTSDSDYLQYIATLAEWQDLRSIAMIQAERQCGEESTVSRRYFISSLACNAEKLLYTVRTHWGIEN